MCGFGIDSRICSPLGRDRALKRIARWLYAQRSVLGHAKALLRSDSTHNSKEQRWAARFRAAHPFVESDPCNGESLRLILGVGRSGTNWISGVMAKTTAPSRFFHEPLFHLRPRLPFREIGDHTAIGYCDEQRAAPLIAAYRLIAHRRFWDPTLPGTKRNDAEWQLCLVKEVHALLGCEALLRTWNAPVVFILRSPVYILDSLLAAQTLDSIYLNHEVAAVQDPAFLSRYAAGGEDAVARILRAGARMPRRPRIILRKLICIHLLQNMFSDLAQRFPHCKAFAYEEFCARPSETFRSAAQALAIPWDGSMSAHLQSTMLGNRGAASDHYAVFRDTEAQTNRDFRFLSAAEIDLCRTTLAALPPSA